MKKKKERKWQNKEKIKKKINEISTRREVQRERKKKGRAG